MTLRLLGHIELPAHRSAGGFDHADIHLPTNRIYVAHTSNDSVDVIDCERDRYIESIPDLIGVAGALVSETRGLVFTSNRGENTVSGFAPCDEQNAFKIAVGVKPNGLAFDPTRNILIAANVGDPSIPDSYSVSVVDLGRRERIAEVKVPGRTRWADFPCTRCTASTKEGQYSAAAAGGVNSLNLRIGSLCSATRSRTRAAVAGPAPGRSWTTRNPATRSPPCSTARRCCGLSLSR